LLILEIVAEKGILDEKLEEVFKNCIEEKE
jgi:hypothetical protein